MRFVIASHNQKKIQEMREILSELGYETISQAQAGVDIEVEETGSTFEENALLKARAVTERTGLPAIADDSGLEVDALDGAPGIYSARYGGEGKLDDHGRNALLLRNMEQVPDGQRQARFVSAIACVFPGESPLVVRGVVEGEILRCERGENGFGYDPLFYVPELGKTTAEIPAEQKHQISHRGRALRLMKEELRQRLEKGEGIAHVDK